MPEGGFLASLRRSRPASEEERCSPGFFTASLLLSVALLSGLPARGPDAREEKLTGPVSRQTLLSPSTGERSLPMCCRVLGA